MSVSNVNPLKRGVTLFSLIANNMDNEIPPSSFNRPNYRPNYGPQRYCDCHIKQYQKDVKFCTTANVITDLNCNANKSYSLMISAVVDLDFNKYHPNKKM
jgi:hypothetical protein